MLHSMPRDMGYTWEGGELKRHITLILATGEQCLIPLDLWEDFEVRTRTKLAEFNATTNRL